MRAVIEDALVVSTHVNSGVSKAGKAYTIRQAWVVVPGSGQPYAVTVWEPQQSGEPDLFPRMLALAGSGELVSLVCRFSSSAFGGRAELRIGLEEIREAQPLKVAK